jgi:hypothetical protein
VRTTPFPLSFSILGLVYKRSIDLPRQARDKLIPVGKGEKREALFYTGRPRLFTDIAMGMNALSYFVLGLFPQGATRNALATRVVF